jgi:hypothetical protein
MIGKETQEYVANALAGEPDTCPTNHVVATREIRDGLRLLPEDDSSPRPTVQDPNWEASMRQAVRAKAKLDIKCEHPTLPRPRPVDPDTTVEQDLAEMARASVTPLEIVVDPETRPDDATRTLPAAVPLPTPSSIRKAHLGALERGHSLHEWTPEEQEKLAAVVRNAEAKADYRREMLAWHASGRVHGDTPNFEVLDDLGRTVTPRRQAAGVPLWFVFALLVFVMAVFMAGIWVGMEG